MKNCLCFGVLMIAFLIIVAPLFAQDGYGKGDHVGSIMLGGVIGSNDLDKVEGAGWSSGAAYRYYLFDPFSTGIDVAYDNFKSHFTSEDAVDKSVDLLAASLLARWDFWPRNAYAAYVSLGLGSHFLNQTFHESTGDRTERTTRFGYFLSLGFEAPLKNNWMWGAELRSMDPLGVSADTLGLRVSLSRRFGK